MSQQAGPPAPAGNGALMNGTSQPNGKHVAKPAQVQQPRPILILAATPAAASSSSSSSSATSSPTGVGTILSLSPEQRARALIHAALRDAANGTKPLVAIAVTGFKVAGRSSGSGSKDSSPSAASVVLYDVLVQGANNLRWMLTRRFAEFSTLNDALENSVRNLTTLPPFPSKEWRFLGLVGYGRGIGVNHFSQEFCEQRLALLDNFLKKILQNSKWRQAQAFLEFLRPSKEDLMEEDSVPPDAAAGSNGHIWPRRHSASRHGNGNGRLSPSKSKAQAISPNRGSTARRANSVSPPRTRVNSVISASLADGCFEPRSFEAEEREERRERIQSLSDAMQQNGNGATATIGSNSQNGSEYMSSIYSSGSSSMNGSRRTSHSQTYEPQGTSPQLLSSHATAAVSQLDLNHNATTAASSSSTSSSDAAATSSKLPTIHRISFHQPGSSIVPKGVSPATIEEPLPWLSPEVSDVSIPACQILRQDHVVYQINVENVAKLSTFSRWTVLKRYSEFFRLDQKIRAEIKEREDNILARTGQAPNPSLLSRVPLLPKRESKFFTDHLQQRHIEKRKILLEVYLKKIITIQPICEMDCVLEFLGCN